jgi:hypothetical protein
VTPARTSQRCTQPVSLDNSFIHSLIERENLDLRVLELADASKLVTLDASRVVGIALDLLLPTGDAGDCQPLPGLPGLGDAPVRVDGLSVDDAFAVAAVVVEVAEPFTRYVGRSHKSGQEVGSCPDLWTEPVLHGNDLGRHGAHGSGRQREWPGMAGPVLQVGRPAFARAFLAGELRWKAVEGAAERVDLPTRYRILLASGFLAE